MKQFTLILILLSLAVTIYASSESYTDEIGFRSAISRFDEETTLDFEALMSGDEVADGSTIGQIQFNYTLPDNLVVINDPEWSGSSGDNLLGVKGDNVFLAGDSVEFAFTNPLNAFGFHIIGSPEDIQADDFMITTNTGSTYNISVPDMLLPDNGGAFFIGIAENGVEPFSSVRFESLDENFEFHIDNIISAKLLDIDEDGYVNSNHNGNDCDDSDPDMNPGKTEIPNNGKDDDCDAATEDNVPDLDADLDGFSINDGDCNDTDTSVYPGAIEICGDGVDQDCNGSDFTCSSNTVTIQMNESGDDVTLESPVGTVINNSQASENPFSSETPPGVTFPYGFFSFSIDGVVPGGSTTMTITLPDGAKPDKYYKYGPTPDNSDSHWYEFMFDGETGAVINDNIITLTFVNGKRGDADLDSSNTAITDPGGPAITDQAGTSANTEDSTSRSSSKCFIGGLSQ